VRSVHGFIDPRRHFPTRFTNQRQGSEVVMVEPTHMRSRRKRGHLAVPHEQQSFCVNHAVHTIYRGSIEAIVGALPEIFLYGLPRRRLAQLPFVFSWLFPLV
jgi:hypothetical protein